MYSITVGDIILLTRCYLHRGTCLNAMKRFCICSLWLAVKESISSNSTYTTEYVDERLMAMRFEISGQSGAVNFISA